MPEHSMDCRNGDDSISDPPAGGEGEYSKVRPLMQVWHPVLGLRTALRLLVASVLSLACFGSTVESGDFGLRVPVLVYHRFGPAVADAMTVTTAVFADQLRQLQDDGRRVIPLDSLLRALAEGRSDLPAGAIVITADDGHRSVYTDMFPLIRKYQVPVTLFIYPSAISNASYALTWDQLAEMRASGLVDIQSHSYWHPNFKVERGRLAPEEYEKLVQGQLIRSRSTIEKHLGGTVDQLAWPFGIYDARLMAAATSAGYTAAFSIDRRPVTAVESIMALPRYIVTDGDRGARFERLVAGPIEDAGKIGY